MAAKCKNLKLFRRSTKVYEIQFRKNGTGTDITGWTIYFTVKENMEDSDAQAVINKEVTSHTSATTGKTQVDLTASDTDIKGSYYYSLDYLDSDGNQGVLFYGRIKFIESVRDSRV